MASATKNSGKLVKTKNGQLGYTKSSDEPVNGKIMVYLSKPGENKLGDKLLCDPAKLELLGYYD